MVIWQYMPLLMSRKHPMNMFRKAKNPLGLCLRYKCKKLTVVLQNSHPDLLIWRSPRVARSPWKPYSFLSPTIFGIILGANLFSHFKKAWMQINPLQHWTLSMLLASSITNGLEPTSWLGLGLAWAGGLAGIWCARDEVALRKRKPECQDAGWVHY